MCQKTFVTPTAGSEQQQQQQQQQQMVEEENIDLLNNNNNHNKNGGSGNYYCDHQEEGDSSSLDCMHHHRASRSSVSPQHYSNWQLSHLQQIWAFHFGLTFLVLVLGALHNGDRKYISVDAANVPGNCVKAFVDVLASASDDAHALICCTADQEGLYGICNRTPSYLIFARRLAQFPEAWLLPVGPLLLRGALRFSQFMTGTLPPGDTYFSALPNSSTTIRRITLYLACLLARGVILYSLFNFVEEFFVPKAGSEDDEHQCWYRAFLKSSQTPETGKEFDFSDHVVLYFAQLIPVALSETIYALRVPFWKKDNQIMPVVMVAGLVYLYFITFLGAYKTSVYFHTPAEIFTGFGVSLLIQIPLCLLQCSPKWRQPRTYFYGQPATGFNTILISAK